MNKPVAHIGALLALALLLSGCNDAGSAAGPPAPPSSATSAPSPAPGGGRPSVGDLSSSGQGLEIRYLDEDGHPKVLRPEDFPRR